MTKSFQSYRAADYFYWTNQDIVSAEENTLLAKFMADSAHCTQAWNCYAVSSMVHDTDSTIMLYNMLKDYALGNDYHYLAKYNKSLSLKQELIVSLNELPLMPIINPDSIHNHRLMYYFRRTYGKFIAQKKDIKGYEAYRYLMHSHDLFPIAQSLADNTNYLPAYLDTYRCYLKKDGYPIMMSPEKFAEAYEYLEYGVECDYLPAIWFKCLLLLTGTYLPQDTVEGKRLLDMCLESPPCTTPFWRK